MILRTGKIDAERDVRCKSFGRLFAVFALVVFAAAVLTAGGLRRRSVSVSAGPATSRNARRRQRAHLPDTLLFERPRARLERRARRAHIVDEQDRPSTKLCSGPRGHEGSTDVAMPASGGQSGLGRRRTDTAKSRADRQAQMLREVGRLIETARAAARWMKRNRHGRVGAVEKVRTAFAHQHRQRHRQRSAALVFQRMHDRAQRSLVEAHGTRSIDVTCGAATAGAPRERATDRAPCRERIPTGVTQRWGEGKDGTPARRTDRPARRLLQCVAADGTWRRDQHGEKRVDHGPHSGPGTVRLKRL